MADEPVRSVCYDVQAAQGASFADWDGWLWTESLGDIPGEYEAIRKDVAMWDVYPLVKWDFRGPDAVLAAQRVFTNDAMSSTRAGPGTERSSTRAARWSTTAPSTRSPTTGAG